MAGRIGQQLGNYRLTQLLGTGGFAEVYLGEHIYLNTRAAIKVLHGVLAEQDIESFHNEARTVARLIHPNIVRVLDFGVDNRIPFLVMDYAPNGTLRQRHPRGSRLPAQTVVAYTKQIAAALQYAHDQRLVHCDLKPENLFVGSKGEILLGDFGIALAVQSFIYQGKLATAGTVAYMAPEQIDAHPYPASDQYALGIIVYEWLTGERPFEGTTFMEVAIRHRMVPPPPLRARVNTVSSAAEMVVMKALAKDHQQRFPNVQAFATALESTLLDPPTSLLSKQGRPQQPEVSVQPRKANNTPSGPLVAPSPKTSSSRTISRRYIVFGLAVLSIGTAAVGAFISHPTWLAFGQPQPGSSPTSSNAGYRLVNYTGHKQHVYTVAWSPDQRWIASGGADNQIHVWNSQNGQLSTIYDGHSESVNALAWSPGTDHEGIIASTGADRTVQVWHATDKTLVTTFKEHTANIRTLAWSPDGSQIASGDDQGNLFIWNPTPNGNRQTIPAQTRIWSVAWSPDGTKLAWGGDDGIVHIWGVAERKELSSYDGHRHSNTPSEYVKALAWSPDSTLVASGSDDHTVHVSSVEPNAAHQTIIYRGHSEVLNGVAWSPRAFRDFIASGGGDHTVQVWSPYNNHLVFTYTQHTAAVHGIMWSPDSQLIASCSDDTTVQVWKAPQ